MKQEDLKKIADAIADGIIAQKAPLPGCGSQSASNQYSCGGYDCDAGGYQCGSAGNFFCNTNFDCGQYFLCYSNFFCQQTFNCTQTYNP